MEATRPGLVFDHTDHDLPDIYMVRFVRKSASCERFSGYSLDLMYSTTEDMDADVAERKTRGFVVDRVRHFREFPIDREVPDE